jgi:peptidoglycan/xylan/chitin deacetylase (PgdA/CDA1 family)
MAFSKLNSFTKRTAVGIAGQLNFSLLNRGVPRDVLVLMYHAVSDEPVRHLSRLYPIKSIREFAGDLRFLKERFYVPTWQEFLDQQGKKERTRRPAVLVTFDDGLSECFRCVRPLLLEYEVPCGFFVTKAFVDNRNMFYRHKVSLCIERLLGLAAHEERGMLCTLNAKFGLGEMDAKALAKWLLSLKGAEEGTIDRVCRLLAVDVGAELARRPYMTADEIRQLHADGFTIGGHSVSHRHLADLAEDEVESEIVESCRFVRELTGAERLPFAFPFTADGISRALLRRVADRYPWIPMMFGTNGVERDEPFLINRIAADQPPRRPWARSNLLATIKASYASCLYREMRSGTTPHPGSLDRGEGVLEELTPSPLPPRAKGGR